MVASRLRAPERHVIQLREWLAWQWAYWSEWKVGARLAREDELMHEPKLGPLSFLQILARLTRAFHLLLFVCARNITLTHLSQRRTEMRRHTASRR